MTHDLSNAPAAAPVLRAGRRTPVTLSSATLVTADCAAPDRTLPLIYRPSVPTVDLLEWVREHRARIDADVRQHGGVLFRGFRIESIAQFAQIARALSTRLIEYGERSSPRTRMSAAVYTSTEHPPSESILMHNEQSYTLNWPMKIMFHCVQPAASGGATPVCDVRRVKQRLPATVVDAFRARQVMYVRNYGQGLGLSWQEAFQTHDRAEVDAYCRREGIEAIWLGEHQLRTRQIRPALRQHPVTGEELWFNHATFFHFSSLTAETQAALRAVVDEEHVAFNTFYGDGGSIEPEVLDRLRAAYRDESVRLPWQQGDLLLLDNMLSAHGRDPFEGPRTIATIMADPVQPEAAH